MSIAKKYVHSAYKAIFQQDYVKAIKYFQQAIHCEPNNHSLYYKLAITYNRNRQFLDAFEAICQAILLEEKESYALFARTLFVKVKLQELKNDLGNGYSIKQALAECEVLLELDPHSIELHWLLAQLYLMINKTTKASFHLDALQKLAPLEDWNEKANLLRSDTNYVH